MRSSTTFEIWTASVGERLESVKWREKREREREREREEGKRGVRLVDEK